MKVLLLPATTAVKFLLVLLSIALVLAEEKESRFSNMISHTFLTRPARQIVYCDNFNYKEKNYTLRYPKILRLDILNDRRGIGSLSLTSEYNYIERIENGAFDTYVDLRSLSIHVNSLQFIDDKVLTEKLATSLRYLDLSKNNLHNLPTSAFQYLISLSSLDLSYNPKINLSVLFDGMNITIFPEALSNLKDLDVSYCNIGYFDDNVFINLGSLQNLHMSGNPITSIPMAIKFLPTLTNLHIQDSQIESINDCDFCNFPNLQELYLSDTKTLSNLHENAFGAISKNANDIAQLKIFSIESCNIQIIPEKLLNFESLERFDIRHNPLRCETSMAWMLKDIISNSSILTSKITKNWNWSDKNFLKCTSLRTSKWSLLHILFGNMCFNGTQVYAENEKYDGNVLYFCENKENKDFSCKFRGNLDFKCQTYIHYTEKLNYSIHHANMKILQKNFTLHGADLESSEYDWTSDYPKLTSLQKDKVFPGHENTVRSLIFKRNKIQTIESGTFDKFVSLTYLDLSFNELESIDHITFPSTLNTLNLNGNKLKLLSSKPFENLSNLKQLNLSNNQVLLGNFSQFIFPRALSNLNSLHLSGCNISILNDNIFENLKILRFLSLSENPLTSTPAAVSLLQNLHSLNISSTDITDQDDTKFINPMRTHVITKPPKIEIIIEDFYDHFEDDNRWISSMSQNPKTEGIFDSELSESSVEYFLPYLLMGVILTAAGMVFIWNIILLQY